MGTRRRRPSRNFNWTRFCKRLYFYRRMTGKRETRRPRVEVSKSSSRREITIDSFGTLKPSNPSWPVCELNLAYLQHDRPKQTRLSSVDFLPSKLRSRGLEGFYGWHRLSHNEPFQRSTCSADVGDLVKQPYLFEGSGSMASTSY